MSWPWIVLVVLAVVVCTPLLIGALTEREHTATVVRQYRQKPEEVWAVITRFAEMASWRDGVREVEILEPVDGKLCVREQTKFGPFTYVVELEDPPHKLVTRIADEDLGFGGTWTYELAEVGGGTQLKITEDGFVDNLFFRFMARWVFGYERTMRAYHDSLAAKFTE